MTLAKPASLSEAQMRVAQRIAEGESPEQLAREEGLRLYDVLSWRYDPEFVAWLKAAKEARVTYTSARAVGMADLALDTIRNLLSSDNERVQLAAAKSLLELAGVGPDYSIEADTKRRRENAMLALRFVHEMLAGNAGAQEAVARLIEDGS